MASTATKLRTPQPIYDAAKELSKETGFSINVLNSVAWLNLLWGRGRKHTKISLETFVDNLKKL